jgi:hypothetical protein
MLHDHVTRLENMVRWRWSAGDVVVWDNRPVQAPHRAPRDHRGAGVGRHRSPPRHEARRRDPGQHSGVKEITPRCTSVALHMAARLPAEHGSSASALQTSIFLAISSATAGGSASRSGIEMAQRTEVAGALDRRRLLQAGRSHQSAGGLSAPVR